MPIRTTVSFRLTAGCVLQGTDTAIDKSAQTDTDKSNVRFAAQDEQIEPITDLTDSGDTRPEDLSPQAHEQIRHLAMTLQKSRLQENRMANFAYEPVSMPPSRVGAPQMYFSGLS
jgi:hypothetical protein